MRTRQSEVAGAQRMCAGYVDLNGKIVMGTGDFTVAKTGVGQYTITFLKAKQLLGATANPVGSPYAASVQGSGASIVVGIYTPAGVATDFSFQFTAVVR